MRVPDSQPMPSASIQRPSRKRADLTTGPIAHRLVSFALPTMLASILQSINGSINAMWVGRLVGEAGLAATANANLLSVLIGSLGSGIGLSVTIFIGQAAGRDDHDTIRRMVGAGIFIFLVMGGLAGIGGWLFAPQLLHLLSTPAPIYPLALAYARVIFLSQPLMLMLVLLQQSLRGLGDSMTPLLFLIPAAIVSALLNPLLILGWGPVEGLGIAGAAVANIIGSCVSILCLVAFIYRRDLPLRLAHAELAYLLPRMSLLRAVIVRGAPAGVQMTVVAAASLAIIGLVNREGTDTAAAYGAVNQLWIYLQMPTVAVSSAVTTTAAHSIGAAQWDRLNRIAVTGLILNMVATGVPLMLLWLGDRLVLGIFLHGHASTMAIAQHIDRLSSWSYMLTGAMMVTGAIPRANGATLPPLIIMILAFFPGRLGAAHLLYPLLGSDAIWWSFPVGASVAFALTALYYCLGSWRKTDLLGAPIRKT